jgi:hypothetical protein
MKVEMIRSRLYNNQTLERGRVAEVDETFGKWLISKNMAVEYVPQSIGLLPVEAPKRGRPPKRT